jgi:hypothetical protein
VLDKERAMLVLDRLQLMVVRGVVLQLSRECVCARVVDDCCARNSRGQRVVQWLSTATARLAKFGTRQWQ